MTERASRGAQHARPGSGCGATELEWGAKFLEGDAAIPKMKLMPILAYFDTNVFHVDPAGGNAGLTEDDVALIGDRNRRGTVKSIFGPSVMDEFAAYARKDRGAMAQLFDLALRVCSEDIPLDRKQLIDAELARADGDVTPPNFWMQPADADRFRTVWKDLASGRPVHLQNLLAHSIQRAQSKRQWLSRAREGRRVIPYSDELKNSISFSAFRDELLQNGLAAHTISCFGLPAERAAQVANSITTCPGLRSFLNLLFAHLYEYHVLHEPPRWSDFDDAFFHAYLIPYVDVFVTRDTRLVGMLQHLDFLNASVVDLNGFRAHLG